MPRTAAVVMAALILVPAARALPGFDRVQTLRPWPAPWRTWAGATDTRTGVIFLHPLVYRDLTRLGRGWSPSGRVAGTLAALDVLTLGHELAHRHGIRNEDAAEREGRREFMPVAARLGVRLRLALRLRRLIAGVR